MNENQTGYRIRHHLNQGLGLRKDTLERLKSAREHAIGHQKARSYVSLTALADNLRGQVEAPQSLLQSIALSVGILALGIFAINTWQQGQAVREIEEIDAAVLAGDLPIDAYLDKGFDAWLKRSSQ